MTAFDSFKLMYFSTIWSFLLLSSSKGLDESSKISLLINAIWSSIEFKQSSLDFSISKIISFAFISNSKSFFKYSDLFSACLSVLLPESSIEDSNPNPPGDFSSLKTSSSFSTYWSFIKRSFVSSSFCEHSCSSARIFSSSSSHLRESAMLKF